MRKSFFTLVGILLSGALLFNFTAPIIGKSTSLPEVEIKYYWHICKCVDDKTKTYEQCDLVGCGDTCSTWGELKNDNCPPPPEPEV